MSEKKSWRDVYKIHPAADLFPMLPEDELRKLGEDIKANGLKEPISLWSMEPQDGGSAVILDGRNRLCAMELCGVDTVKLIGTEYRLTMRVRYLSLAKDRMFPDAGGVNPFTYTMSKNVHRRHLTKEQRADIILQAVKLEEKMDAEITNFYSNKRSFNPEPGQRGGSTENPVKKKFIEKAEKQGISKATAQKSWDKDRGPVQQHKPHQPKDSKVPARKQFVSVKDICRDAIAYLEDALKDSGRLEVLQVLGAINRHFHKDQQETRATVDHLLDESVSGRSPAGIRGGKENFR